MEAQPIRLMIVDDQAMVRRRMKAFLDEYEGISVIGETAGGTQAVQLIALLDPDVVLIDLLTPEMDGIETIRRLMAIRPEQCIIVLTAYNKGDKILQAIKAGAMGYLVKDANPEELIRAIRGVHAGLPAFDNMVLWNLLTEKTDVESYEKITS